MGVQCSTFVSPRRLDVHVALPFVCETKLSPLPFFSVGRLASAVGLLAPPVSHVHHARKLVSSAKSRLSRRQRHIKRNKRVCTRTGEWKANMKWGRQREDKKNDLRSAERGGGGEWERSAHSTKCMPALSDRVLRATVPGIVGLILLPLRLRQYRSGHGLVKENFNVEHGKLPGDKQKKRDKQTNRYFRGQISPDGEKQL